jgi:hypothetical protein
MTTALLSAFRARVIDEDAAHHACGHGKKMRAVVPLDILGVDQPEIRLVHERCRLKAVVCSFVAHVPLGNAVELPVYERHEAIERPLVALSPSDKQAGELRGMARNGPF